MRPILAAAGLNCNSADFATLPPHFKDESKSQPAVVEAMELCFGPIIESHNDYTASVEFSYSVLQAWSITLNSLQPKWQRTHNTYLHRFHCYTVHPDLLADLTGLVSLDEDKTMKPTGIPPHVRQAEALKAILKSTSYRNILQC